MSGVKFVVGDRIRVKANHINVRGHGQEGVIVTKTNDPAGVVGVLFDADSSGFVRLWLERNLEHAEAVVQGTRTLEFKDVQVGDLIKVTERIRTEEESTIKTIRVSSISQTDRGIWMLESSQTFPVIRIYISKTGRLYNQTIELLDRPTAVPKRQYAVGDVVSADDLSEVDVEVVVRYADVTGAVSLGVVIPGSDEIVFPDARMSLGGITRQTRYEIIYVEKEGSK